VVNHLDEMAGAVRADVGDARAVVYLRGDLFPDRAQLFVSGAVAAGHQGRPPERTLLAARDAAADEVEAFALQRLFALHGVFIIRVAAVNDDVALIEMRLELLDDRIHGTAGFDQQDDLARALDGFNELLDGISADDLLAFGVRLGAVEELVHL